MEKRDMTILEASRALGYTKNAVKYQAGKLTDGEVYKDNDGILRITPAGLSALQDRMGKKIQANQETTAKEPANNQEATTQQPAKGEQQPANNQETTGKGSELNSDTTTKEPANNQETTGKKDGTETLQEGLLLTIEALQAELKEKNEQIARRDKEIEKLHDMVATLPALLDQQQRLQAQYQAQQMKALESGNEEKEEKQPFSERKKRGFFGFFQK